MAEVPAAETANLGPISRARASLAALESLERLHQTPNTPPSPEDLTALRGWSGWGPLAPALDQSRSGTWAQIGERIAYLLDSEHYDHGIQATYNAFYTPPEIAAACWNILTGLGFRGGRILEPGCGAGVFMDHTPPDLTVAWTGVERDPTTAAIAKLLHPGATIHAQRLEENTLPSHSVDAVLGNVPFADTKVYDPTTPRELTSNLHNYFIWRAIQALRPGGVAVLITSRYTLDAAGDTATSARLLISREAELLGAVRLPSGALTSGGTEALVDVLVLRRRRADEPRRADQDTWMKTAASVGGQHVNEYLLANPQMVLGELAEDNAPRYGRTLRVNSRPDDPPVEKAFAAASRTIIEQAVEAGRIWRVDAGASPITAESAPFKLRADGRKEGSFHLVDGVVHEVVDAQLILVERPGKELPKLIALRDAVLALLDAEASHSRPDAELAPLRAEANQRYDAYVKAHGYLNRYTVVEGKPDEDGVVQSSRRRPSMGGFRRDPDFVTVLALEDFDDDTRTATKAALLTRRINRPRERATHAESPAEAIALCRDELGRLDLSRVADLLGVEIAEAERRIADVAFLDPTTESWVPADEYLTGNVREKLSCAKTAATLDPERFSRNVPALEAVIPADLQPEQISANLGAPWIPASDVQQFARELLNFPLHVWHEPRTSTWSVHTSTRARESAAAISEWGTGRLNAYQLLEYSLNGKAPVIYDVIDERRVRNQDETLAANDRLEAIASRFSTWVWEDPDRADRLTHAYNQTFNAVVPRRFDGAHLTFPGLDSEFEPYPHQRDMVARMISGADALCPYPVGTGKTATMFIGAVKLRALGLASKPLIIVVPSTLEQIARDGKRLFPNARILMAGKEDLADARARKLFAARCAMEDWDAVVMSHPCFTSLPVHPTVKAAYVSTLAADYRSALISAKADGAEPRKIKQIAKMVDNLEADAKALLSHATDDGVFFEHLGVDYLLVDEMHYFKNLGVPVHTDGFAINGSKRAQDLDMKLTWLRERHPGAAVITGFTGTPVSNTLLEAFILQHYLQPQRLAELGLESADAWAANFVRFATTPEITPDDRFMLKRRPAEIVNIPELMHTLAEVAELRPSESFPVIRPEVRRHTVAVEASDTVREYVLSLAERADDIHAGGVPSSVDNILKICSDGRKVALHESLVGLRADGPGKIGALVDNVARTYHQTKDLELPGDDSGARGRLQLVFCDLGTPNKDKGNQVYGLIRHELIDAGVPAERIRFIHEATTDARRLVLFDQCNKGDVNVLLGSTDKLGVGVNVQRRAIALHHVDAPWRPDQVEQRDGRVWRPKNLNPAVEIYRYVTEGSFDAFMWQALERKEKSLRPILAGQATARSIEDIGDIALDYGQIKAISTGNPLLTELNEVAFEVKRLTSLATSHQRAQRRLRSDIQTFTMQASAATVTADALEAVAKCAAANHKDAPWRDPHGNVIAKDDETALLGALAERTIAKGYCDGAMRWRELSIDFTASKQWRDTDLTGRITAAGRHRITVPLNAAWAAKGQHWRIRDAIATAVNDAHRVAAETRENVRTLAQRIAENEAALGQPFPDEGALDAARARRALLEATVRNQAQKDEEARRNRTSRATDTASAVPDDERHTLLARLHTAFTALVDGLSDEMKQDPQAAPVTISTPDEAVTGPEAIVEPNESLTIASLHGRAEAPIEPDASQTAFEQQRQPPDAATAGARPDLAVKSDVASDASTQLARSGASDGNAVASTDARSTRSELGAKSIDEAITAHDLEETDSVPTRPAIAAEVMADPDQAAEAFAHEAAAENTRGELSFAPTSARAGSTKHKDSHRHARSARPARVSQRSLQFEHAIDLALQGFAVFPLRPGTKEPLIKEWERQATTHPRRVAQWWSRYPNANIAIACGPSNLLVIDLDVAKTPSDHGHGQQTLNTLAAGREVPQTFTVASARGGRHLYYRQPEGTELRNTAGGDHSGLGPLIDTRGHGGYVVAPGSTFAGGVYRIERDALLAPLPTWIVNELQSRRPTTTAGPVAAPSAPIPERRRTAYGSAALRRAANTVAAAPEGTRNHTLNREAFRLGRLIGGGVLHHHDAATTLRKAARKAGLSPHEIENTLASGLTAGIARPRSIPDHAPAPQTGDTTKEVPMSMSTTDNTQLAGPLAVPSPNPAIPYPHLSAPGARAFQDALRTLWRLGPAAIGLPETASQPVRAAWQEAGEQMAAAIREHEASDPASAPDRYSAETASARAAEPTPTQSLQLHREPDAAASLESDIDFEDIWADVRDRIETAQQALPDPPSFGSFDDVQRAIDDLRASLAQTPISMRSPVDESKEAAESANTIGTDLARNPARRLDEHLATVDSAFAQARSAAHQITDDEWTGIRAVHTAIHNLWDTIKAAAGMCWAQFAADARIHGLLTTLAAQAARAIATLTSATADRLEQRTSSQPPNAAPAELTLREAYIEARRHIRAHAASHEWQRITALWNTVNTLTRQTTDPGIRAVVARSADAISDHADALCRKTTQQGNHRGMTDVLANLARAAERHAVALRGGALEPRVRLSAQSQSQTAACNVPVINDRARSHHEADAQGLQASARQVAQRVQARLGQPLSRATSAPRRTVGPSGPSGRHVPARPMQPAPQTESGTLHVR